ncbi:MAG TPA: hypothetical protein VNO30_25970 [Kofleriaceae bacterium]|nr:hypothetical protein [Kofleriaceae bacterium]
MMNSLMSPPPVYTYLSPAGTVDTVDTHWAIAGEVPVDALTAARGQLPEFLQAGSSEILSGNDGMSVLLVYDGPACDGEYLASTLSEEHRTPVYFLDFHEYAPRIRKFDGTGGQWQDGHPAAFLRAHGITAPGYEEVEQSSVVAIGVVEGATMGQARKAFPELEDLFAANSRGVLVTDISGLVTDNLARALRRRGYVVFYDRAGQRFLCTISEPGWRYTEGFSLGGWPTANCKVIDSILGETTIDGILRVLDIPRRLLLPDCPDCLD